MLSNFETQFQSALRSKLAASVRPRVQIATGAQNQTGVLIGVTDAQPVFEDFKSRRNETTPGSADPKRIMRLRCHVQCRFIPIDNTEDRGALIQLLDQVMYALDDDDFRSGEAFDTENTDRGFVIRSTQLTSITSPIKDTSDDDVCIALQCDGWFWPVGQAGQAGVEIGQIRIRGSVQPLMLIPAEPMALVNGPNLTLSIQFDARGTTLLGADGTDADTFGELKVRLQKADGTLGSGVLAGGVSGSDHDQVLAVVDGQATFQYTPPSAAGRDFLVVSFSGNDGTQPERIGSYAIETRAEP